MLESSSLMQLTKRKSWHNQLLEVTSVSLILDAGTYVENFVRSKLSLRAAFTPSNVLSLTARVLICLANVDCPTGSVKCGGDSPRRTCITSLWLCNGVNNCGNNWDENSETCGWLSIIDLPDWYVLINYYRLVVSLRLRSLCFHQCLFVFGHCLYLFGGQTQTRLFI